MKKLGLLLFTISLTTLSFCQWHSNYGIGIDTAKYKLDVNGEINISSGHNFLINGEPITLDSNKYWSLSDTNLYYNSGNIGIGVNNPEMPLHISTSKPVNYLIVDHTSNGANGSSAIELRQDNSNQNRALMHRLSNSHQYGGSLFFENVYNGSIVGRFVLSETGNVGIGMGLYSPSEQLEVKGKIKSSGSNSALILTSSNGTEFEITVDNSGNLTATQVTTSLKSKQVDFNIDIYPNPADNELTILVNDQNIQTLDAEIYNLTGKMIFMKNYSTNTFKINTSDFASGTYLLKLKNSEGNLIKTEKFIKQ